MRWKRRRRCAGRGARLSSGGERDRQADGGGRQRGEVHRARDGHRRGRQRQHDEVEGLIDGALGVDAAAPEPEPDHRQRPRSPAKPPSAPPPSRLRHRPRARAAARAAAASVIAV